MLGGKMAAIDFDDLHRLFQSRKTTFLITLLSKTFRLTKIIHSMLENRMEILQSTSAPTIQEISLLNCHSF